MKWPSESNWIFCALLASVCANIVCAAAWMHAQREFRSALQEIRATAAESVEARTRPRLVEQPDDAGRTDLERRVSDLERKIPDLKFARLADQFPDFVPAEIVDSRTDSAAPSPEWRTLFADDPPLRNVPVVLSEVKTGHGFTVTVMNIGVTPLEYTSGGKHHIQLLQEVHEKGAWKFSNWDWCGTGKSTFEFAPGEIVELDGNFWDPKRRERMLGLFSERFPRRRGVVVLATENDDQ